MTEFWKFFFFLIILALISSCKTKTGVENVERSFYYWKSDDISVTSFVKLKELKIHKLYYKLFEIDYNDVQGNFPYNKNRPNSYDLESLDSLILVPTVFIRNEIFQFNDEKSLDKLADNMVYLIQKYLDGIEFGSEDKNRLVYDEIQIDCDYTKSSREKYFYLLKKIKLLSKKKISCTLRLYPFKYPDIMGVPPVDKATLMCYNLINPLSRENKNTILDIQELKKYLDQLQSYPLHLDVALPVFFWTQHFQNNRFVGLLDLNSKDVQKFSKEVKPFWYQVMKDTIIGYGNYLKAGDQLKCEDVSAATINQAIQIIREKVKLTNKITVTLFDLDNSTFNQYSNEEISGFYNNFTK